MKLPKNSRLKVGVMDISDIKRLNTLWAGVYPYLAKQVISVLPEESHEMLEIGPFSGGISFELAKTIRGCSITIVDSMERTTGYLAGEARLRHLSGSIRVIRGDLSKLPFHAETFDAVIFRGAFFFLDESMLRDIHRLLAPRGVGFVGGGFGVFTPRELIDAIARESRRLNQKLGRKWVTRDHVEEMVMRAGLERCAKVIEDGGLWVLLWR
jgi:ubiquinone/menaquinone biosynthesis C-methylase UbiE